MTAIYDLLACPACKSGVDRSGDQLRCPTCATTYPILDGVPIMTLGGRVPDIGHEQELDPNGFYFPWIHRLVLQSLLDDQVVLEIGSGSRSIDDPAIIRMDVMLTPYVDVVADAHAVPFRPATIDFVFSLAVVEHLRQPFLAAEEMYRVLKDGGYVYNECNFVFAYHGYPHHYFNATIQGLQQVFSPFRELRTGVAPYQMPSHALLMVLGTYLRHFRSEGIDRGAEFAAMLTAVLQEELIDFDRGFTEEAASMVAAGTYLFGVKQTRKTSTCLPAPVIEAWRSSSALQARFPDPVDLGKVDNLLLWARGEGAAEHPRIREHLGSLVPFAKHGEEAPYDRSWLRSLPLVEPVFGTQFDYPECAPPRKSAPSPAPGPAAPTAPGAPATAARRRLSGLPGRAANLRHYWRQAGTKATLQRLAHKVAVSGRQRP